MGPKIKDALKAKHQVKELADAFRDVTNIATQKSAIDTKLELLAIISSGIENKLHSDTIVKNIVNWASK